MIIPVQIYNYFKGYAVSKKVHERIGPMGGAIPIRLIDVSGFQQLYNGTNPMYENNSLLDYFTNAWLYIEYVDLKEIMNSSVGMNYPTMSKGITVKSIGYGSMIMMGPVIPTDSEPDYLTMIDDIFISSLAILGYYERDSITRNLVPIKEIDVVSYDDWCYIIDDRMNGFNIFDY